MDVSQKANITSYLKGKNEITKQPLLSCQIQQSETIHAFGFSITCRKSHLIAEWLAKKKRGLERLGRRTSAGVGLSDTTGMLVIKRIY